jgi:hypothetical protein
MACWAGNSSLPSRLTASGRPRGGRDAPVGCHEAVSHTSSPLVLLRMMRSAGSHRTLRYPVVPRPLVLTPTILPGCRLAGPRGFHVTASQSWYSPSAVALTRAFPSGRRATLLPVFPMKGRPTTAPVAASWASTQAFPPLVSDAKTVRTVLPSALITRSSTDGSSCACSLDPTALTAESRRNDMPMPLPGWCVPGILRSKT